MVMSTACEQNPKGFWRKYRFYISAESAKYSKKLYFQDHICGKFIPSTNFREQTKAGTKDQHQCPNAQHLATYMQEAFSAQSHVMAQEI